MITDDPNVRQKLGATRKRLAGEFEATAAGSVAKCFERAVGAVVTNARIAEFLPMLVERHTRDCLDGPAR
jgi:hypothetical protein